PPAEAQQLLAGGSGPLRAGGSGPDHGRDQAEAVPAAVLLPELLAPGVLVRHEAEGRGPQREEAVAEGCGRLRPVEVDARCVGRSCGGGDGHEDFASLSPASAARTEARISTSRAPRARAV